MNYKSIELCDKKIFDEYYKTHEQYSGYLSFTTLYTWKELGNFRYAIYDGEMIIKLSDNEETYLLAQTTKESIKKVVDFILTCGNVKLKALSKNQVEILKELYGEMFTVNHIRDNDNYYYLTESMISLQGKKLHSKRNFINRFKKENEYSYERITKDTVNECINVAKEWCERKNCNKGGSLINELSACEIGLLNMDSLGLKGGAIRVGGKIVAFSLGELLNEKTVLVHFEKADTDYNGIYQVINNEFLKNEWADTIYVNREEDMGVEGLRKAKMSYCPEFLLEYYEAIKSN